MTQSENTIAAHVVFHVTHGMVNLSVCLMPQVEFKVTQEDVMPPWSRCQDKIIPGAVLLNPVKLIVLHHLVLISLQV